MTYLKAGPFIMIITETPSGFGWEASTIPGFATGWQSPSFYPTKEESQQHARDWLIDKAKKIEETADNVWNESVDKWEWEKM